MHRVQHAYNIVETYSVFSVIEKLHVKKFNCFYILAAQTLFLSVNFCLLFFFGTSWGKTNKKIVKELMAECESTVKVQ